MGILHYDSAVSLPYYNIINQNRVLDRLILAISNTYIGIEITSTDIELAEKGLIDKKLLSQGYLSITSQGYYVYKKLTGEIDIDLDIIFTAPGTIIIKGEELFFHPIIKIYHEYILRVWNPISPGKIALFTPCSNIKPIPRSFMNRKIDAILRKYGISIIVDRYIVSEPLGIIPYSQAYLFPAAHYDYPPDKLTAREKELYINIVASVLKKISKHYDFIIYSLPRKHKEIFEQALDYVGGEAIYVPYNIYYLPKLRDKLLEIIGYENLLSSVDTLAKEVKILT